MNQGRANRLLTGLVTVTLVTSQVPAAALAEEAQELKASVEQLQGATHQDADAAVEPASAESEPANGVADSAGEQPATNDPATDEPAAGEQPEANEPAQGVAGEQPSPADPEPAEPAAGELFEDSEEQEEQEEPAASAAEDPAAEESAEEEARPVVFAAQGLRYHKGELTKKGFFQHLKDNFDTNSLIPSYTVTYQNPDSTDGDSFTVDANWSLDEDAFSLKAGTYRVDYQKRSGKFPKYKYTPMSGTMTVESYVKASFAVDGCEAGSALVGGSACTSAEVDEDGSLTFGVQSVDSYQVSSVSADGSALSSNEDGTYTITCSDDVNVTITYVAAAQASVTVSGENVASATVGGTAVTLGQATNVAAGTVSAVLTPADGYAITGVTLDGTAIDPASITFANHVATVPLGSLTKDASYTLDVTCAQPAVSLNGGASVGILGHSSSEYKQIVFDALVNAGASVPAGLTADDVTIQYNAGGAFSDHWRDLDDAPSGIEGWGQHAFGQGGEDAEETVRVTYVGNAQYPSAQATATVRIADGRIGTHLALNSQTSVRYDADADVMLEAIYRQLGISVIDEKTGKPVNGLTQDDFTITFAQNKRAVGTHEVTVKFRGNETYKKCEATVEVTVTKAPSSLSVANTRLTYGSSVAPSTLVSSDPSLSETMPIVITAGVDGDAHGYVSVDLTHVNSFLQAILNASFGLDQGISLADFAEKLEDENLINGLRMALAAAGIEDDAADALIDAFKSVVNTLADTGLGSSTIALGGTPTKAGVYLVSAISTSGNYETSVAAGYLTIAPRTEDITLGWNQQAGTSGMTMDDAANFDFGATAFDGDEAVQANVVTTFVGRTATGESYYSHDVPMIPGTYAEFATLVGGNYFATPIARTFTILQMPTHIVTEGGTRQYNGSPAVVSARIADDLGGWVDHTPTVTYSGTTYDGQAYYSETAPSLPGEYEVKIVFAGTTVYAPCGAEVELTIEPRPVNVTVEDASTVVSGDGDPADLYGYQVDDSAADTSWAGDEPIEDALGLTFACAGAGAQVPGTYEVTAATSHPGLFDLTVTPGAYTVLPRLTVNAEHGSASVTGYDRMAADGVGFGVQPGSELALSAGQAEDGWKFDGWEVTSGTATIADATAAETTLTVGDGNVVVTARYSKVEPVTPVDPSPSQPGDKPSPSQPGDKPSPSEPGDKPTPSAPADKPSASKDADVPSVTPSDKPGAGTTDAPQSSSADKDAASSSEKDKTQVPKTADASSNAAVPAVAGVLALLAAGLAALRRRLG